MIFAHYGGMVGFVYYAPFFRRCLRWLVGGNHGARKKRLLHINHRLGRMGQDALWRLKTGESATDEIAVMRERRLP